MARSRWKLPYIIDINYLYSLAKSNTIRKTIKQLSTIDKNRYNNNEQRVDKLGIARAILADYPVETTIPVFYTRSRSTMITPFFFDGQQIYLYDGKSYIKIIITEKMLNHRLGEFVPTKKIAIYKKKKEKGKKSF